MIKRKKETGFTLIELLAVILIIAIISMIAIPIVNGVMQTAKKGALKDSAYALVKAADYYLATSDTEGVKTKFTISESSSTSDVGTKLPFDGKVDSGSLTIYSDTSVALCISSYGYYALKQAGSDEIVINDVGCNPDTYEVVDVCKDETYDLTTENANLKVQLAELNAEMARGKKLIADAITAEGINTLETDSFDTMADNIGLIPDTYIKNFLYDGTAVNNDYSYGGTALETISMSGLWHSSTVSTSGRLLIYLNHDKNNNDGLLNTITVNVIANIYQCYGQTVSATAYAKLYDANGTLLGSVAPATVEGSYGGSYNGRTTQTWNLFGMGVTTDYVYIDYYTYASGQFTTYNDNAKYSATALVTVTNTYLE